jgi:hypothetical protein
MIILFLKRAILDLLELDLDEEGDPEVRKATFRGIPIELDEHGRPRYICKTEEPDPDLMVPPPLADYVSQAFWSVDVREAGRAPGRYGLGSAILSVHPGYPDAAITGPTLKDVFDLHLALQFDPGRIATIEVWPKETTPAPEQPRTAARDVKLDGDTLSFACSNERCAAKYKVNHMHLMGHLPARPMRCKSCGHRFTVTVPEGAPTSANAAN